MRVSLKWLREYVDLVVEPEELAHRLTMAGLEVEEIERIGADWQDIFVGQVVALEPHPNADRLQLARLDYGGQPITTVAGAFNIKVGDKVAVALAGAKLFDGHAPERREIILRPTKIRGVLSEGMACSEKELGLSEDHSRILVLHPEARVGAPLWEELGDTIFRLKVTPNRPDCLCMLGVAREVAALTGQKVRYPEITLEEKGPPAERMAQVEIADPELCPRYIAKVITSVRVGPSPKWLQDRLIVAEMRPINNIVDATNYVMLEMGQPLHAFDYRKIWGHRIVVRRAKGGEALLTLDGVLRALSPDMLVIADASRAVAVAGVMGGAESEVSDDTTAVLLESANFHPASIRRTARALKLPSEASRRFERGQPPENTLPAARRCAQLIRSLAGGVIAQGEVDAYPNPKPPCRILLLDQEIKRLLGVAVGREEAASILTTLECPCQPAEGGLMVTVPPHRGDVRLPADLVEEVARIQGYDTIPTTLPGGRLPAPQPNPTLYWENLAREVLVGCGYAEVITYSLISRQRLQMLLPAPEAPHLSAPDIAPGEAPPALVDPRYLSLEIPPLRLLNPLSTEMECLRTSPFASLLEALRDNLRHQDCDVDLFEIGKIYLPRPNDLPEERRVLAAASGGWRSAGELGKTAETDFFDLKGAAEELLQRMGILDYGFMPASHPTFHPGRVALIVAPARPGAAQPGFHDVVGILGEVHQQVRSNFDLGDERAYLLGLDLDHLIAQAAALRRYHPLPKFPAVIQDLAVIVDLAVPAAAVREQILAAGGELVADARLFDVYTGEPIPPGKKSLAYRITYQAPDRTLTDQEVQIIHDRIGEALQRRLGAQLRA